MRFHLWARTGKKIGSDSFVLLSKLLSVHLAPANISNSNQQSLSRDILLREAQESNNTVAVSYLRIEKELNLMRYHGFMGYLRQSWWLQQLPEQWSRRLRGLGPPLVSSTFESQQQRSSSTMARVAFMITAAQRAALVDKLGYTAHQIKQLTPLEATLILEHNIQPIESKSRLKTLVQDYHASLSAAASATTLEKLTTTVPPSPTPPAPSFEKQDSKSDVDAQHPQPSHLPEPQPDEEADGTKLLLLPTLPPTTGSAETVTPATAVQESTIGLETTPLESVTTGTRLWHQVVAIAPDGTEESIGLFPVESEAKVCQETKEHLAAKHTPDRHIRFEVRTTRR
jgi:hypothetical protein